MDKLQQFAAGELDTLRQKGTFYRPRVLETEQKATVIVDGHEVITLSSNNYLGLTVHPRLREAAIKAIEKYGVGSGSVRTIAGTMSLHVELEEKLAPSSPAMQPTWESSRPSCFPRISSSATNSITPASSTAYASTGHRVKSIHTETWPGCVACLRNRAAPVKSWW